LEAVTVTVLLTALIWAGWFVASNNFYRWDEQPLEFGLGVSEAVSPVKASAFVKEQNLPPPLYNDWGLGGYLTWDRPVPGGVYIDSRAEVYDDQFFSDYLARLAHPDWWQDHADHMGFQTVIFCYWYASHRHLETWLLRDPRWALVYFDENTTVFVRRQGNEALIEKVIRDFQPLREKQVRTLLEPVSSWQWPAGRARALLAYGNILTMMGRGGEAVQFFERLLEIGASPKVEKELYVRLARYYADTGEMERARAYLQRAVQADPDNPDIAPLRNRLGG
jgi:tetratricopeptide (TPR) repeat protein